MSKSPSKWRTRSLPSLLSDPSILSGAVRPGNNLDGADSQGGRTGTWVDVLKIDVECSEWGALEACLDAGEACYGRIGQIALEVHNCPDYMGDVTGAMVRGGAAGSAGGSIAQAVSAYAMSQRTLVLRRLRDEAGFRVMAKHDNPLAYHVDVGAYGGSSGAVRSGTGRRATGGTRTARKERCCSEVLLARVQEVTEDHRQEGN